MKVAIIVDVRGWALDHIANDLVRGFGECEFEIDVLSWHEELRALPPRSVRELLKAYDVLWPFDLYEAVHIRPLGFPYITTVHMAPLGTRVGTKTPFDLYWKNFREAGLAATALSTICPPLINLWAPARGDDVQRVVVGGDPTMFYPPTQKQREAVGGCSVLRVGWVGNPLKPYKQYNLVKQAVCNLPFVDLRPVLWNGIGNVIPRTRLQMAAYYRDEIDVYVCVSDHEGLPTPAVECALCGVPVISVRTGIASEIVENGRSGYLIDQSVGALRSALEGLVGREDLLDAMGQEIALKARPYQWRNAIGGWLAFLREGARRIMSLRAGVSRA